MMVLEAMPTARIRTIKKVNRGDLINSRAANATSLRKSFIGHLKEGFALSDAAIVPAARERRLLNGQGLLALGLRCSRCRRAFGTPRRGTGRFHRSSSCA